MARHISHPSLDSEAMARSREFKAAMRRRVMEVAISRDLSDDEIKPVLKLEHEEVGRFAEKHRVNLAWLLEGAGPMFKSNAPRRSAGADRSESATGSGWPHMPLG